jgi:topoisomerase IA-like protein
MISTVTLEEAVELLAAKAGKAGKGKKRASPPKAGAKSKPKVKRAA